MALKIVRLPREEFRAHGYRTIATPFFLIKIKRNAGRNVRVGVVAGKSVAKTATGRNFWKRQTKEVMAKGLKGPLDALIIISPRVADLTKKKFREELSLAAAKIPKTL